MSSEEPARSDAIDSPDGVDLTLVRWMLSLTPEERLRVLQDRQTFLEEAQAVRERGPHWIPEPS
ncbi:MAG: hypothetical protein ACKVXR_00070 [Planctomycetota bacterium]